MDQDIVRETPRDEGSLFYVARVCFVATIGGLLFGFDTAVISGTIPFITKYFSLSDAMLGWTVSSLLVGAVLGAGFAGTASDRFGRKKVLLLCAVLLTISAVCAAIPRTLTGLILARFIGGLGVGAASMLSPMYIAEIAPARIRGRLVSLNQLAIVIGILLAFFADYRLKDIPDGVLKFQVLSFPFELPSANWRWMFGSQSLGAVLFFVFLFFVPESPRWLAKQKREAEAAAILTKVGGADHAKAELSEIKEALGQEQDSLAMMLQPGMKLALVIGIVLAVLQQVTGINVVMYYAPVIFAKAGSSVDSSLLQAVAVGVTNLIFTLVAVWGVDRFGRKVLLLAGSSGMGVFLALLSGAFHYGKLEGPWVLLCVLGYVACFCVSLGPVVWVMISEIFPNRVRGRAMSIATVCLWIACFLVSQTFPIMLKNLAGAATFGIYAMMCAVTFVFVFWMVPETKGKTLEEIEKHWLRLDT